MKGIGDKKDVCHVPCHIALGSSIQHPVLVDGEEVVVLFIILMHLDQSLLVLFFVNHLSYILDYKISYGNDSHD